MSERRAGRALRARDLTVATALLVAALGAALLIGPADLPVGGVLSVLGSKLGFPGVHPTLDTLDQAVVWQIRAPRVVLGAVVGATLATAGGSYQGAFQNALADPYLLGVAAGAGLGATIAIAGIGSGGIPGAPVPLAAFIGAVVAVAATYALGRAAGRGRPTTTLVLAGVAVGSFLTAIQTFLQQRSTASLTAVYSWILGGLSGATWSEVRLVTPYIAVALTTLLVLPRRLDVLSVGDEEASSLGIHATHVRLTVVIAATLATAAAVSVSGLIGFVGIIVPHTVRLLGSSSYRRILPVSLIGGAGFLVLCDLVARTVLQPSEVPIGLVTATLGAPFFLIVLRNVRRFG